MCWVSAIKAGGFAVSTTLNHSPLLSTTHHYSPPLTITLHHSPTLSITLHHSPSLSIILHHSPLLSTTLHHSPPLSTTLHHSPSLSITLHQSPSISITLRHFPSLSTTLHHSASITLHQSPLLSITYHHSPLLMGWSCLPSHLRPASPNPLSRCGYVLCELHEEGRIECEEGAYCSQCDEFVCASCCVALNDQAHGRTVEPVTTLGGDDSDGEELVCGGCEPSGWPAERRYENDNE